MAIMRFFQGIGIKGKEMALDWHEKAFADKFGKPYTHSSGTDTQQSRKLQNNVVNYN